jgi:hypothetical protein
MAHLDLVAHVSQSSFEMREMLSSPSSAPLYEQPQAQIGRQQHIGPRYGRLRDPAPEPGSVEEEYENRREGFWSAWSWWHLLALVWAVLISAVAIAALVVAAMAYDQFVDYKQSNNKHVHALQACCSNNTGSITIINNELIQTNVTNIFGDLATLFNETAILEQCCLNNTIAIQTLNTELWDLTLEVWFDEAAIDILQENVGSLQLQIDNL